MIDPCTEKEYKATYSLEYRLDQTTRVKNKYPDRLPIFIEARTPNLPRLHKPKFLIPTDLNIGHMLYILKKRLNIDSATVMYLYVNGRCIPTADYIIDVYNKYMDPDEHLYMNYRSVPNTWLERLWYKIFD